MTQSDLQAERTRLAWRRTSAALATAAVLLGRLALPEVGYPAVAAAAAAFAGAGWTMVAASARNQLPTPSGIDPRLADSVLADGRAVAIVTGGLIALCLVELTVAMRS